MARHGSTAMTELYSRSRIHRHHELAASIYDRISGAERQKNGKQKMVVGSKIPVSEFDEVTYGHSEMVAGGGFEPPTFGL